MAISTLQEFKQAVDSVWSDISASCAVCTDPDCLGYIWLAEEEEEPLLDAGVQIVQINGKSGPLFLDSYQRDAQGRLILGQRGPRCPWRGADGRCTVHGARPLVCHMYPFGIDRVPGGGYVWSLHHDCQYVRSRSAAQLEALLAELRGLLDRTDRQLIDVIVAAFLNADSVVGKGQPMDCYIPVAPLIVPVSHD
jgi:Fe-S-cluster containining protein